MKPTTHHSPLTPAPRRGGAVIIVVLTLLTSLLFLGLFYYSWSRQAVSNADNFAQQPDAEIDPDVIMAHAYQQVTVSTPDRFQDSALYGGVINVGGTAEHLSLHSLLANTIGIVNSRGQPLDVKPHSGRGITVVWNDTPPTGNSDGQQQPTEILFDYNGDGMPDATAVDFDINFSATAHGGFPFAFFEDVNGNGMLDTGEDVNGNGTLDSSTNLAFLYTPDAGYSYPDVNSLFLAYDAVIPLDTNGNGMVEPGEGVPVRIPSFLRPQFFPARRAAGSTGFSDVYTTAATNVQVLRPHVNHEYAVSEDLNGSGALDGNEQDLDGDGMISAIHRYVVLPAGVTARSGDRTRIIAQFPFFVGNNEDTNGNNLLDMGEDSNNNSLLDRPNDMGVFSGVGHEYRLDVDADGDGILDSIWIDLDHPILTLEGGRQAVPLFYFKIIDADALANVNAHGDDPLYRFLETLLTANAANPANFVYGETDWLSHSNMGLSPSEVNLGLVLAANPLSPLYIDWGEDTNQNGVLDIGEDTNGNGVLDSPANAALRQHRAYYGSGTLGFSRLQMANTELFWLLSGRLQFDEFGNPLGSGPLDIPGRFGEVGLTRTGLLGTTLFPRAGASFFDDDRDDNAAPFHVLDSKDGGLVLAGQKVFLNFTGPPAVNIPGAIHPLDPVGMGVYLFNEDANGNGVLDMIPVNEDLNGNGILDIGARWTNGIVNNDPDNPSRFPQYLKTDLQRFGAPFNVSTNPQYPGSCFWQFQNGGYALAGPPVPPPTGPYALQPSAASGTDVVNFDGWIDEADELVSDASFPNPLDAPFPPSELTGLQLADAHFRETGEGSRLRQLMPFNLEANRLAAAIRSRLTTDSRDRLEHGFLQSSLSARAWEFNDTLTDPAHPRFPPAFGTVSPPTITSRHESTPPVSTPTDPFRPLLRRLLTVEQGNTTNIASARFLPGQRLNINRLLVNYDQQGNPLYRRLTPHPTFTGDPAQDPPDTNSYLISGTNVRPADHQHPNYTLSYYNGGPPDQLDPPIPANGAFPPVSLSAVASDKYAQEVWARYDRQRMARDIYVLLYTLCAPDADNPTTAALTSAELVVEMAQFAVNYVDALDQDSVITRFEFDTDLSDGWNITAGSAPYVDGVEAQQLTFSEALWIRAPDATSDFQETIYTDDDQEHQFLYIELRNAAPLPINLADQSWRIVRVAMDGTRVAQLEFKATTGNPNDYKTVPPGKNFLIATHDGSITDPNATTGSTIRSSDFYVNTDTTTPQFEAIVPDGPLGPDPAAMQPGPAPLCDLDLCYNDPPQTNYFTLTTDGSLTKLVGLNPPAADTTTDFVLVLERRRNLGAAGVGQTTDALGMSVSQDWIEVDRMLVTVSNFAPTSNTDINTQLQTNVRSQERRQPLTLQTAERGQLPAPWAPATSGLWMQRSELHDPGSATYRNHTLSVNANKHGGNSRQTTPFNVWQPHFDRDFSSVYELLSVPVFPPQRVVEQLTDSNQKMSGFRLTPDTMSTSFVFRPSTSAGYALAPAGYLDRNGDNNPDDITGDGMPDSWLENRWHRLFELLELPPRTQDAIRDAVTLRRRTDGKINLNTLRHEENFAAIVDDDYEFNYSSYLGPPSTRISLDRSDGFNWFDELLVARDGLDPITTLPLPGVPGARPFRSPSYIDPVTAAPDLSLNNTILRNHLNPVNTAVNPLGLFEARSVADITAYNVDFHTRNRLLCKIANNTTNRSHVFMIWAGYELFEAHQPAPEQFPNVVQIGARITDLPGRREFTVVDMTRLEEAYNPGTGSFDWRKFIIYRKRIK